MGWEVFATLAGTTYYCGLSTSGTSFTITAPGQVVSPFPFASDTTAGADYDGLLTITQNQGNVLASTGAISANGDKDFQTLFLNMFNSSWADPDELWLNVAQAKSLSDWLRTTATNSTAAGYRLELTQDQVTGAVIGSIVSGLVNESSPTRKVVQLKVHPYMPYGSALVRSIWRSRVLPLQRHWRRLRGPRGAGLHAD